MEKGYYDPEEVTEAIFCYFDILKEQEEKIKLIDEEVQELLETIESIRKGMSDTENLIFSLIDEFDITEEEFEKMKKEAEIEM